MLTVLGLSVIGIIAGISLAKKSDLISDVSDYVFFGVISAAIGLVVGLVLAMIIGAASPKKMVAGSETNLITLKDKGLNQGSFFLGIGRVDEGFYYVYYYMDDDGYIRFGKVNANRAKVSEEERKNAILTIYEQRFENDRMWLWAIDDCNNCWSAIFRVPTGTVVRNYNLDLK